MGRQKKKEKNTNKVTNSVLKRRKPREKKEMREKNKREKNEYL